LHGEQVTGLVAGTLVNVCFVLSDLGRESLLVLTLSDLVRVQERHMVPRSSYSVSIVVLEGQKRARHIGRI
jgi:hypothetical protein